MKFGKNLIQVVSISNPEWGQYWINYKFLKKKLKGIVASNGQKRDYSQSCSQPESLSRSAGEVDFFKLLRRELQKTSDFFGKAQEEFRIRWDRIRESYQLLQQKEVVHDKYTWTRLLSACVKFYKDVLLLENFAIMNYCGFSKILKKHDKNTGYRTRKAFMDKVMQAQNFTHYPFIMSLIRQSEKLFQNIQTMESAMPLQDEERLFIDAIRGLNFQASRMQAGESMVDESRLYSSAVLDRSIDAESDHEGVQQDDISQRVDEATSVLVDAALKLSHQAQLPSSPDLKLALSWMHTTVKANPVLTQCPKRREREDAADLSTDEELLDIREEDEVLLYSAADGSHGLKKAKVN